MSKTIKFPLFDCQVRHSGNMLHTITKRGITAYELRVLKQIHGDDSVIHLKSVGELERDEHQEHLRLARVYGVKNVERVFGPVVEDFSEWIEQQLNAEADERDTKSTADKQPSAVGTLSVKKG